MNNPSAKKHYSELSRRDRHLQWEQRTSEAEWDVPNGRVGGLVLQLRFRGNAAGKRAQWMLYALLLVILVGLGYYVIKPLLQLYYDGGRQAYNEQLNFAQRENQRLDAIREKLKHRLVEALSPAGLRISAKLEDDDDLTDILSIPDINTLIAVGDFGQIFRSPDNGASWTAVTLDNNIYDTLNRVIIERRNNILISVGENGLILRSETSGAQWSRSTANNITSDELTDVTTTPDSETFVAVGKNGAILRTVNSGKTWTSVPAQSAEDLNDIISIPKTDILIAVGKKGSVYRSIDSGLSWNKNNISIESDLTHIINTKSRNTIIAVGLNGTIIRSTNNGNTWTILPSPTNMPLEHILQAQNSETLLILGRKGTILRSTDDGMGWSAVLSNTTENLRSAAVIPGTNTMFAVGSNGSILRSIDDGASWRQIVSNTRKSLTRALVAAHSKDLIAVGGDAAIVRVSNRKAEQIGESTLTLGAEGDAMLESTFNSLGEIATKHAGLAFFVEELASLKLSRAATHGTLEKANDGLKRFSSGAFTADLKQDAFKTFMTECRSGVDKGEYGKTTQACAEAFIGIFPNNQKSWWNTIAEEVPRGILLLFLLSTLGTLYRYNLRLSAFHYSRADALELLSTRNKRDDLELIANALAADKVEFGKANTPTDQAIDILRIALGRVK